MNKLELFPVEGIGALSKGDDLAGLIAEQFSLEDGDVVVVSSKAVSKTEGNVYTREDLTPSPFARTLAERTNHDPWYCELVLRESADIVRMAPGVVISRTRHGFVLANAGVDASNAGGEGRLVALPKDPDGSARRLRQDFLDRTGKNVAVIISDTFGRTWRVGQTDLAVGVAGLSPLRDYRGEKDADGRAMSRTCLAHADELASAAELVRGKAEGIPAVVVRGYQCQGDGAVSETLMPADRDLFR